MAPKSKLKSDIVTGIARKKLSRNHLPSELDIISYFRFQHENLKLSTGEGIQIVATEAVAIWNQAGLPHQLKRNVVRRIFKLVTTWQCFRKSYKKKKSKPALKMFKLRLSYVFNISVDLIADELRNDAARLEFWNQQVISKIPIVFPESFESSVPVVCKQCNEKKSRKIDKISNSGLEQRVRTVREPTVIEKVELRRSKRVELLTNAVIENMDRTQVSNRGAVGVLAATAVALGFNSEQLSLSRSTLQRKRKVVRQEISKRIHEEFPKEKALVVHFDSKQLMFNRRKTEKLAIVVSGSDSVEQIINTTFLESGTGQAVAEAVFESLKHWSLDGIISGKCYDTTNVNSGEKNGAAVLLERMLGRKLLDFPCRHHIFELVLMTAYKTCFDQATSSPDDALFKTFRSEWEKLDKNDYVGFPKGNIV